MALPKMPRSIQRAISRRRSIPPFCLLDDALSGHLFLCRRRKLQPAVTDDTTTTLTVNASVSSLALTTPASATSINQGSSYTIDWTGGNSTDTVQLWAEGGPNNAWTELTSGVPQTDGSYTWNTTGVMHGWYHFQAWDIPASGTSYAVQSPNWLHVVVPGATAPNIALTNPPLATDSVAQGNSYTLNFTATDGNGDTNPVFVQLWVYSGDTGKWSELPNANYLPSSPGFLCLGHHRHGSRLVQLCRPRHQRRSVVVHRQPRLVGDNRTHANDHLRHANQRPNRGRRRHIQSQLERHRPINCRLRQCHGANLGAHLVNNSPVWVEIDASASASSGTYAWTVPTSPGAGTYYAFSIWLNDGDQWWAQASPNWLQAT